MRINGQLFAWDEEQNDIVEMKTKNATPSTEPPSHQKQKIITLLNFNARSLVNKAPELEATLLALEPRVVTITETWLHPGISNHEVFPPGYVLICRDRQSRGGGVAILLKQDIIYTLFCQKSPMLRLCGARYT